MEEHDKHGWIPDELSLWESSLAAAQQAYKLEAEPN